MVKVTILQQKIGEALGVMHVAVDSGMYPKEKVLRTLPNPYKEPHQQDCAPFRDTKLETLPLD